MGNDLKGETDPMAGMEKYLPRGPGEVRESSEELKRVRAHLAKFKQTNRVEGLGFTTTGKELDLGVAKDMLVLANIFHPPTSTSFFTLKGATYFLAKIFIYVAQLHKSNPVRARASAFISCVGFQLIASALMSVQAVNPEFTAAKIEGDLESLGAVEGTKAPVNDSTWRAGQQVLNSLSNVDTKKTRRFKKAYERILSNEEAEDDLWEEVVSTLVRFGWKEQYQGANALVGVASLLKPLKTMATNAAELVNEFLSAGAEEAILICKSHLLNAADTRRKTNLSSHTARVTEFKGEPVAERIGPWVEGLQNLLNDYQERFNPEGEYDGRINLETFSSTKIAIDDWINFLEPRAKECPYRILESHFEKLEEIDVWLTGQSSTAEEIDNLTSFFPYINFETIEGSITETDPDEVALRRIILLEHQLAILAPS